MNQTIPTASDLRRAADIRERIDDLEKELNELLGGVEVEFSASAISEPRKRRMSAAGRARIAAAAKARWAAFRKSKNQAEAKNTASKKRSKFSPAAKARLSALAKARWAKARAAGKARL